MLLLTAIACTSPVELVDTGTRFETGETGAPSGCASLVPLNGTLTAHTPEDADAFCEQYNAVVGEVYVGVPVNCLCSVEGKVNATSDARLPALREAHTLSIKTNTRHLFGYRSLETVYELRIRESSRLEDLQGLEQLENLTVLTVDENESLTSLTGLNAQALEGAAVSLTQNPELRSLNALQGVTMLRSLMLDDTALTDLSDLSALEEATGWLTVSSNRWLTSLSGLESLQRATDLRLTGNPVLTGLIPLTVDAELLSIKDNPQLSSLVGLEGVTGLSDITIEGNGLTTLEPLGGWTTFDTLRVGEDHLTDLAVLQSLTEVNDLRLTGATPTSLEDLAKLRRVESFVLVGGVRELDALSQMTVARNLHIQETELADLDGLDGLRNMRDVHIKGNAQLTDITALHDLKVIYGDLTIVGNPLLGDDAARALVEAIGADNIEGVIVITGNEP